MMTSTMIHLLIPPSVDIYVTNQKESGLVEKPPGDGWGLAATNGRIFIWTRSKISQIKSTPTIKSPAVDESQFDANLEVLLAKQCGKEMKLKRLGKMITIICSLDKDHEGPHDDNGITWK
jgi:hypothetical protein